MTGLIVLVAVLAVASGFGVWRRRTDGIVHVQQPLQQAEAVDKVNAGTATAVAGPVLTADRIGRDLGSRATLLQFSSAFCQPCRAAKVVLADVASRVEGVEHVEIDAESHLELVREVGILRTPTTLVLDGSGRITARAAGVPRREQVLAALDVSVR